MCFKGAAGEAWTWPTLFHMGYKHSVLVWQGTLAVCTLAELFVEINNVMGNGKVAHKHIVRVAIHFTDTAHNQLV